MKTKFFIAIIACSLLFFQSCSKKETASSVKRSADADLKKSLNTIGGISGTVPDGTYKITLAISSITTPPVNRTIGVTGASAANGSFIELRDYTPNLGEEWAISSAGSGYYSIININSGKALTLPYSHAVDGTPLIQYDYIGANSQLWQIVYQGEYGLYKIISKLNNSLGVNVTNSATANGAGVTLSNLNNNYAYFFLNTVNLNVTPGAIVARVTGATPAGETYPNPNKTDINYDLGGCDLGIMWATGPATFSMFFGDSDAKDWHTTADGGVAGTALGHNTLAFSSDTALNNGVSFNSMAINAKGHAAQVIPGDCIPTSAIRIGTTDYAQYVSIKTWKPALALNMSAIAYSTDNGQTWTKSKAVSFPPSSKFSFVSYAQKDGYVYMVGTPVYRSGHGSLARFLPANILNQAAYQYWNGTTWITNSEASAVNLFASSTADSPAVGEASIAYNTKYKKWIMVFTDSYLRQISMRYAASITGPWSAPIDLASGSTYFGIYGGYINPLKMDGDDLYYTISLWFKYNVFLMKSHIQFVQ